MTGYDFADRPSTLLAQRAGKPDQPIVSSSVYLPAGPLKTLTLGNGLTETHAYSQRYLPSSITLGSLLSWTYSTDKVGNISGITDNLTAANDRTYGYQDDQYFLTQGNGPWGTRAWTYDRIGNRLTETRSGVTDTYTYQLVPAPGTGHSPILSSVALGAGGTRTYQYDPAGNLQQITQGSAATLFTNDAAGHLAALSTTSPASGVSFQYDGRDYLTLADTAALPFLNGFESGDLCGWSAALGITGSLSCPPLAAIHPTYSSEGLLHALQRATAPQRSYVFHFAGRPVAQMDLTGTTESWKFLTTDHLGTPIVATNPNGTVLWQGGFEPFGADWNGAGGAGVFLRFPGQWVEVLWGIAGTGLSYNLHRWYQQPLGRYSAFDPLSRRSSSEGQFTYALSNPIRYIDILGLYTIDKSCKGCPHPVSMRDKRTLADIAKSETDVWCATRVNQIKDVVLRNCIKNSCRKGKVTCSSGGMVCDGTTEGYSSCGRLCQLMVRIGVADPARTAVLCGNNPVFWDVPDETGGTVIHEWAHGCGYDPDNGSLVGVPQSGG